jgi:hypothetical protein
MSIPTDISNLKNLAYLSDLNTAFPQEISNDIGEVKNQVMEQAVNHPTQLSLLQIPKIL